MKNSFIIYHDYKEHLDMLNDEELGVFFRAIMAYEIDGIMPEFGGMLKMAFSFVKAQLDRDAKKYEEAVEQRRDAGRKSAESKKTKVTKSTSVESVERDATKSTDNVTVKDNVDEDVNDNDNDNAHEDVNVVDEVIDYLNMRCGTEHRANTKTSVSAIKARINEGYKLEDFKCVIDKKCKQWRNRKDMAHYLRPITLFGSKFDGYLNEIVVEEAEQQRMPKRTKFQNYEPRKWDYDAMAKAEERLIDEYLARA